MPDHHFTEKDIQTEWQKFLENITDNQSLKTLVLKKGDENVINVLFPSEYAKSDFQRVEGDFLNHFKHKVKNFYVTITYQQEKKLIKKQETKRDLFMKYVEINPVLKDLDDLLKFDLS